MSKRKISKYLLKLFNEGKILSKEESEEIDNFAEFYQEVQKNKGYTEVDVGILHTTDYAYLISEIPKIWIPKSESHWNKSKTKLYISDWIYDLKDLKNYRKHQANTETERHPYTDDTRNSSFIPEDSEYNRYCGACMENPCACSDPF